MDVHASADLPWPVEAVFAEVRDLSGYPAWLDLVETAVPAEGGPAPAAAPAWTVTLAARLGPLRREKTVRMIRAAERAPGMIRFERAETDGRPHPAWVLTATVRPLGAGAAPASRLDIRLHYAGGRRLPLVDLALRAEMARAGGRLAARLAERAGG